MSTGLHKDLPAADIHTIAAWIYADDAERLAATGFVAADLYKMAYQISSGTPWLLIGYSPIAWTELAAGSSPQLNRVQVRCVKASAGTLTVGQAAYVASWDSVNDRSECELAKADSPVTMPCVGIINAEATDSTEGSVLILGVLHNINTVGLAALSPVYLSHTVAGGLTTTPPPGPYVTQALGQTLRIDATTGHLGVNILSYRAYDYTNTPEPLGTAAAGTRNVASPSDHVHALPKLDDLNAPDDNTDLNATTSAHGLLPKLGGGSSNFLRADGTWNAPSSVPLSSTNPVNVTKAAASAGSATEASRQDHKHDITTAAAGTLAVGASAAEGSATSLARSDHAHAVTAPGAPASVTKAAASAGSSSSVARSDHKHDITTATASAQVPGDSAAEGTATSLARSDHKHSLPAYGSSAATICQGNDSRLSDARTPTAHATTHKSGGSDSIKLDELAAPTDITTLNATTGAHGLLPKLGGGSTNYLRADGTWAAPPGAGSIFGQDYQTGVSASESSTTSTTFQTKLSITTPALTGTYRVGWSARMRHSSAASSFEVQCQNTTDAVLIGGVDIQEPKDTNNQMHVGAFQEVTFTGAAKTFAIQARSQTLGTTYISEARIELWRVS